jgi:hypothetical protein
MCRTAVLKIKNTTLQVLLASVHLIRTNDPTSGLAHNEQAPGCELLSLFTPNVSVLHVASFPRLPHPLQYLAFSATLG